MPYRGAFSLAALLLWSLAAGAADFDVPELGVHLAELPAEAVKPEIVQRPGGYQASTSAGAAHLTIYRDDAPVAAGSDVASPRYRESLDRRFGGSVDSKMEGAPTALAGHSGWTVVDARENEGRTDYRCVTYVIVDAHLYRLEVSAFGTERRPPQFDALVRAMSAIRFEPVQRDQPADGHA